MSADGMEHDEMEEPYIELSVEILTDPRMIAAGSDGCLLWVIGLCYAKDKGTDWSVPKSAVDHLVPGLEDPQSTALKLVSLGLWESTDTEFTVPAGIRGTLARNVEK